MLRVGWFGRERGGRLFFGMVCGRPLSVCAHTVQSGIVWHYMGFCFLSICFRIDYFATLHVFQFRRMQRRTVTYRYVWGVEEIVAGAKAAAMRATTHPSFLQPNMFFSSSPLFHRPTHQAFHLPSPLITLLIARIPLRVLVVHLLAPFSFHSFAF